jgi:quercetin dioxygenase-like cupin family protein
VILRTVDPTRQRKRGRGETVNINEIAPYALGSEEGESLWGFGSLVTIKASAGQTGGAFSLIELLSPNGVATPLHVHPEDYESFYVLEGELTFYLEDGEPIPATAGSFFHVPGWATHAFQVDSETARYLVITTSQHEHFYRGISEPAQERRIPPEAPLDMQKIMPVAQEYKVEILGPPPGVPA